MTTIPAPHLPTESHDRRPSKRWRRAIVGALAATAAVAPAAVAAGDSGQAQLATVRAATAKFHQVEVAEEAGHQLGYIAPFLLDHCISHPTAGGMGYHWFNHAAIDDIAVDALSPEGLVYEPGPNGQLRLVAVEWIVPVDAWHAAGNTEPPSVLGQDMHVLNPALGWYILHAWVWKPNPSGMMQDWNPNVLCP